MNLPGRITAGYLAIWVLALGAVVGLAAASVLDGEETTGLLGALVGHGAARAGA